MFSQPGLNLQGKNDLSERCDLLSSNIFILWMTTKENITLHINPGKSQSFSKSRLFSVNCWGTQTPGQFQARTWACVVPATIRAEKWGRAGGLMGKGSPSAREFLSFLMVSQHKNLQNQFLKIGDGIILTGFTKQIWALIKPDQS